ncbi:hypothetical protein ACH5RR_038244 [Cinchona calisaya]|uniref:Homeobox-leucine zipper protein n=1 Tax=Cinchona calisaya TaxID=153742 RepID=A0ABD2XXB7_9GENT
MFERRGTSAYPIPSTAWTPQIPSDEEELQLPSMPSFSSSNNNSKRRFNDDQVRFLESMYQADSRPALRVKQQLANKLGLQPRQVAIWFQNKRARSKSKEIEQEYSILKASYDDLASKFQSLKRENESLHIQVQRLRQLTVKGGNENIELETDDTTKVLLQTSSHELHGTICQNSTEITDCWGEGSNVLYMHRIADGSLTSTEDGYIFETNDLIDNSTRNSEWWEM